MNAILALNARRNALDGRLADLTARLEAARPSERPAIAVERSRTLARLYAASREIGRALDAGVS
jgi:hypothetical protein